MPNWDTASRGRILANADRRILVVTNFKCGFTAVHRAVADDAAWTSPAQRPPDLRRWLATVDIGDWQRILITRNPYDRFLSYYFNFVAGEDEPFPHSPGHRNIASENLTKVMPPEEFQRFAGLDRAERATAPEIERFASYLPLIYMINRHTHPQCHIWKKAGLRRSFFTSLVDTEDLSTRLGSMIGATIAVRNKSLNPRSDRAEPLTRRAVKALNECYAPDFTELGYPMDLERPVWPIVRRELRRVRRRWHARRS